MSLVYITHHNENINNIDYIPRSLEASSGKIYTSKFSKFVRDSKPHVIHKEDGELLLTSSNICKHQTMGCGETPLRPPCDFLRKNSGVKWRRLKEHVCPPSKGVPAVPRREPPRSCHQECVNFIKQNIEKATTIKTKRPPPRYIDTPVGESHNLVHSGLIPQYICGKNFGKVPCYINLHKKMLKKYKDECKVIEEQKMKMCDLYANSGSQPLSQMERQQILAVS